MKKRYWVSFDGRVQICKERVQIDLGQFCYFHHYCDPVIHAMIGISAIAKKLLFIHFLIFSFNFTLLGIYRKTSKYRYIIIHSIIMIKISYKTRQKQYYTCQDIGLSLEFLTEINLHTHKSFKNIETKIVLQLFFPYTSAAPRHPTGNFDVESTVDVEETLNSIRKFRRWIKKIKKK